MRFGGYADMRESSMQTNENRANFQSPRRLLQ